MSPHLFTTASTVLAFSYTPATFQGLVPWLVAIGSLAAAGAAGKAPKAALGGLVLGVGIAVAAADFLGLLAR